MRSWVFVVVLAACGSGGGGKKEQPAAGLAEVMASREVDDNGALVMRYFASQVRCEGFEPYPGHAKLSCTPVRPVAWHCYAQMSGDDDCHPSAAMCEEVARSRDGKNGVRVQGGCKPIEAPGPYCYEMGGSLMCKSTFGQCTAWRESMLLSGVPGDRAVSSCHVWAAHQATEAIEDDDRLVCYRSGRADIHTAAMLCFRGMSRCQASAAHEADARPCEPVVEAAWSCVLGTSKGVEIELCYPSSADCAVAGDAIAAHGVTLTGSCAPAPHPICVVGNGSLYCQSTDAFCAHARAVLVYQNGGSAAGIGACEAWKPVVDKAGGGLQTAPR